jgi:hypothetical protein
LYRYDVKRSSAGFRPILGRSPPQNLRGERRQVEAGPQAVSVDKPTAGLKDRKLDSPPQAENDLAVEAVPAMGRPSPQLL